MTVTKIQTLSSNKNHVTVNAAPKKHAAVMTLESMLSVKFKGPFSDGREYDATVKAKGLLAVVVCGEMGQKLGTNGWKEIYNSSVKDASFCFSKEKVFVAFTLEPNQISILVYSEDSKSLQL
jgi:hypothetical protein